MSLQFFSGPAFVVQPQPVAQLTSRSATIQESWNVTDTCESVAWCVNSHARQTPWSASSSETTQRTELMDWSSLILRHSTFDASLCSGLRHRDGPSTWQEAGRLLHSLEVWCKRCKSPERFRIRRFRFVPRPVTVQPDLKWFAHVSERRSCFDLGTYEKILNQH